jgi:hypothetical protein
MVKSATSNRRAELMNLAHPTVSPGLPPAADACPRVFAELVGISFT